MRRTILLCALLAACREPDFWAFSSNNSTTPRGTSAGFAGVAIWISDSPIDTVEGVSVTIDGVELVGERRRVLSTARHDLELLELRHGRAAQLADTEVEAGRYDRLRLSLAGARVRSGGATQEVLLATRHIDLEGPLVLREGERLELHVDFDVRMSFVEAGGTWTLRPHLTLVDASAAAFASGAVHPAPATVSAQQAGFEITSTRAAADGAFRLGPLPAGTYTLVVTAAGFRPEVRRDVRLRAGETSGGHLFQLAPAAPGAVTGVAPPGSLVVRVLGEDGALVDIAGVAPDGTFTAAPLPAGASFEIEFHDAHGLLGADRVVAE